MIEAEISVLYVANRCGQIDIVYYCPRCEAVNELVGRDVKRLLCRECHAWLSACSAALEVKEATEFEE
jgi:hypothetical protein